ncbi:PIR Superfamily Protein [Plasmodium ovale curtisi]|uniref:PIR Superfamily Protein n=1 Tax=Plasmodium ovale curtisi TaxID=864141 RepID=A0A1A8WKR1_PLAOA|nr:PIR Superfamily Protein [Plasmodium ovale curtisi]
MDFETENEYYNVVNEFPVCKGKLTVYNENYTSYYEYLCQHMITDFSMKNSHYIKPCEEVLQCLNYLNVYEPSAKNSSYCKFVNYWLNNLFHRIPNNLNSASNFYRTLKKHDASNKLYLDMCKNEIKNITKVVLYNIEVLYNLHYNLNKYISSLHSGDTSNCYYANSSVSIYENHINVCYVHYKSAFCKLLNKFKDHYNQKVPPEKKCDKIKTDLSYLYIENQNVKLQENRGYGNSLSDHTLSGSASPKLYSPGKSIAACMVLLLVTPFTLLILYKFTPLRTWIHPRIQEYIGKWKEKNKENTKQLSYNSLNEQITTYNNDYYITYNSLPQL